MGCFGDFDDEDDTAGAELLLQRRGAASWWPRARRLGDLFVVLIVSERLVGWSPTWTWRGAASPPLGRRLDRRWLFLLEGFAQVALLYRS